MDANNYWAITEGDIEIQNPVTDRKLRLLDDYCDVGDGLRVLDIGCGKAWLMRYWADKYTIIGTGLDINPRFVNFARARRAALGALSFIDGPALDFEPTPEGYDIVMCLGASSALGGLVEAIDWMVAATRPGGKIVLGEMTLKHRPLSDQGEILPHEAIDTIGIIERHGAQVSALISASDADFERYASHHRHATLTWAGENPAHPDNADVLARSRADWQHYLKWIRPYFGWTVFVGRKPAEQAARGAAGG
ncbi:MAG TPA: methyltransferase domain-containing protein [Devosiaceae bacterium]|nr:methyltransferase domain-containing protein [Devosiaceae bacterium]